MIVNICPQASVTPRIIAIGTFAIALGAVISIAAAIDSPQATSQPATTQPATTQPVTGEIESDAPWSGGIIGSKHDMTGGGRVARDLCTPCHTPHITAAEAPLKITRPKTKEPIRTYQMPGADLDSGSLLCLSCHDGIVAPDVYAGAHGTNWNDRSVEGLRPGGNRLTSHPVGVLYPTNDPKFNSVESVTSDGRIKLRDGRIQCASCHDPHNTQRHERMLRMSNDRSRLCLTCHRL